MNIGGALGIIGTATIGSYPWGVMVAKICNFHLPDDKLVTLDDTGTLVMEKIVAMDDKIQVAILTMDIGNLEGFDSSSSRGVNVMKSGAVIIALAMVVIGTMATFIYSGEEGGMDGETLEVLFGFAQEVIRMLLGMETS